MRSIEYRRGQKIEDALHSRHGVEAVRTIETIVRLLVAAGDLETTLLAERARIDATLKLLATRRQVVTP